MASVQVKIEKGLHKEVKKFVDESEKYSGYKAFYEEAARKELERQQEGKRDFTLEQVKQEIIDDLDLD